MVEISTSTEVQRDRVDSAEHSRVGIGKHDEGRLRWFFNDAPSEFERSTAGAMLEAQKLKSPNAIKAAGFEYSRPAKGCATVAIRYEPRTLIDEDGRPRMGVMPSDDVVSDWVEIDKVLGRIKRLPNGEHLVTALTSYYGRLGEQWESRAVRRLVPGLGNGAARHGRIASLFHLTPAGESLLVVELRKAEEAATRAKLALGAVIEPQPRGKKAKRKAKGKKRKEKRADEAEAIARHHLEITPERAMVSVVHAKKAEWRDAGILRARDQSLLLLRQAWRAWRAASASIAAEPTKVNT